IRIIIATIIRVFLGVLGLVALVFTLYGGYLYMTAAGDESKLKTAKAIIKNMVIGLAIILSAFGITQFIINMLVGQYQGGGGDNIPAIGADGYCTSCGFLGSVVESHYPGRGAVAIPRNTKIVVTFKYEMSSSTLIQDTNSNGVLGDTLGSAAGNNDSPAATFKIYETSQGEGSALPSSQFDVFLASDKRTYVFKPKGTGLLGNAITDTNYTVKLTDGIRRVDGSSAFGPLGSFSWSFTVSTIVDLTPPEVVSVIPVPQVLPVVQTDRYPRNIVMQINFNEPVDPISASGIFRAGSAIPGENFQNITAADLENGSQVISGKYQITNQYKTVEFTTFDQCGVNPCGQPIYCIWPVMF
ncbi:MAG: Ig-like domain-containing protein, partial [Candidatus Magasanikbacteria bacterium]|nr:Ig-like domain-containing protein [Candidatus Magasanikbacteria bacterium]